MQSSVRQKNDLHVPGCLNSSAAGTNELKTVRREKHFSAGGDFDDDWTRICACWLEMSLRIRCDGKLGSYFSLRHKAWMMTLSSFFSWFYACKYRRARVRKRGAGYSWDGAAPHGSGFGMKNLVILAIIGAQGGASTTNRLDG